MPAKKHPLKIQKTSIIILLVVIVVISFAGGALGDRILGYKLLDRWFPPQESQEGVDKAILDKLDLPFLGVRYKVITKDLALLNEVPEGAYIVEVLVDSPAEKAGVKKGDIVIEINGKRVRESGGGITGIIQEKKIDETIELEIWRENKILKIEAKLESSE